MTITYTQSADDLIAFNQHAALTRSPELRPPSRLRRWVSQGVLITVCMALGIRFGVWGYVGGIFGWALVAAAQRPFYRWRVARWTRRMLAASPNQSEVGTRTVRFDEGGIESSTPTSHGHLEWSNVQHVAVTERHVFVYTSVFGAFVVPRSAMSDHEMHALVGLIQANAPAVSVAGAA